MIKVFLGGEGPNDIGRYSADSTKHEPGVAETLLRRVRSTGWQLDGTRIWRSIRKYRAGGAAKGTYSADVRNVQGLVLEAYEQACELLAFLHDHDGDEAREAAILVAIRELPSLRFGDEYKYELAIVDGVPLPELEGWVLCLLGHHGTDAMTSARVERELAAAGVTSKSTAAYVDVAASKPLPTHPCSLREWLTRADAAFRRLIDGEA